MYCTSFFAEYCGKVLIFWQELFGCVTRGRLQYEKDGFARLKFCKELLKGWRSCFAGVAWIFITTGAGGNALRRLALFVCLSRSSTDKKMTSHPVEKSFKRQNQVWIGHNLFSASKVPIFYNRPGIFNLFYLVNINKILSSSSSYQLVGRTGRLPIQKTLFWRVFFFLRNIVISLSPNYKEIVQESSFVLV